MKKIITSIALIGISYFSYGQCAWKPMPVTENVTSVARVREDKKVVRHEVFTLADGSVYAAYLFEDDLVALTKFNAGVWDIAGSAVMDGISNGPVNNMYGWAMGKNSTGDKIFVCGGTNGILNYNITTSTWAYSPTTDATLTKALVKDMAFHPTSGEVYILRQPTTTTLKMSKLSGATFGTVTDLGLVADVTTNTVTYNDGSFNPPTSTNNTIATNYVPQFSFYGSSNDILVTCGLINANTGLVGEFFPRAFRYNNGTSLWGKVLVNYNGINRESFMNFATSNGFYAETRAGDFDLSTGKGRPYLTGRCIDPTVTHNAYVMNLTTNEAHDVYTAGLINRYIINTFSDANDHLIVITNNGIAGVNEVYERDINLSTWSTLATFPTLSEPIGLVNLQAFNSFGSLFALQGGIATGSAFGDYNSNKASRGVFKTKTIATTVTNVEANAWLNDNGLPSTYSKLFVGATNEPFLAYADSMYTDSTYRVAFVKWNGTAWVNAGIDKYGAANDQVEDFDVMYNGTDYYLAHVKPAGNCDLIKLNGFGNWFNLGTASSASSNGAVRFVRISPNGGSDVNILTDSKTTTSVLLNLAQYIGGVLYPGQSNSITLPVATKYDMQVVSLNSKTLMMYRNNFGMFVKYLNGATWADWSTTFNTDFGVVNWKSFDATYNSTSSELYVSYTGSSTNTAFKRAKINATGDYDATVTGTYTQLGSVPNAVYNTGGFNPRTTLTTFGNRAFVQTQLYSNGKQVLLEGNITTGVWTSGTEFTPSRTQNFDLASSSVYGIVSKWGGNNLHVFNLPLNPPEPISTTTTTAVCSGKTATLTVSSAATVNWYTVATGGTLVATGTTFVSPTLTTATTFYAEATTACGTSTTRTAIPLTINANPTVLGSVSSSTICSGTSVTFNGSGASTYTWNNGVTDNTAFTIITGGNYIVTGTNANGCVGTGTVAMVVNHGPVLNPSFTTNDTLCQGSVFSINTNTTGITNGSLVSSTSATLTFGNPGNITATNSISYYISGDSNGCKSYDTLKMFVQLTSPPTIPSSAASYSALTVSGFNNDIVANGTDFNTTTTTSVDANIDGCRFIDATYTQFGTPTRFLPTGGSFASQNPTTPGLPFKFASYTVNNTLTLFNSGDNGTLTLTAPRVMEDFYILATGGGGSSQITAVVNFADGSTENISSFTIDDWFNGSSYALEGTGRMYNNALGFQAPTDNNPRLYQYLINISVANKTKFVNSVTFTRSNSGPMKVQIMGITGKVTSPLAQNFCSTAMVSNLVATGTAVKWYTSATGGAPLTSSTNLSTGTYYASQTVNSCESNNRTAVSVVVASAPTLTINASNTVVCNGVQVTLTASGANTYTWTGGIINNTAFTPTTTTSYTVSGTSVNGCTNTSVKTITVNALPSVTANSSYPAVCLGYQLILTGGGASSYTWSNGVADGVAFTPSVTATYTVTGFGTNGCSKTSTVNVLVNSLPTITVNGGAICIGNSFTIVPSGGVSYVYSSGSNVVSPTSSQTYIVTGADANGCKNTVTASVTVNALPTIVAPSATICAGSTLVITATGASTYSWSTGANTASISVSPTANTSYTVAGTSAAGCAGNAVVTNVTIGSAPSISVNSNTVCAGISTTLTANGATTYTWSTGANGTSIVVTPTISTTYTVSGNLTGCTTGATNVSNVTVNPKPTVIASTSNTLLCVGQTASLTASGANTYAWSNTATSAVIAITPTVTTTYTVTGTNANGCKNITSITQNVSTCTGINASIASANAIVVYPNPSNGDFNFDLESETRIVVLNALGAELINEVMATGKNTINLNAYATGVYFMKAIKDGKQSAFKLIKN